MNLSFYTIDDLRLGRNPQGGTGWRLSQFLDWRDALDHYRSLPDTAVKSLGVTNGVQVLELVRCLPLAPDDRTGEHVLLLDFLALPLWQKEERVFSLAGELVDILDIRYCLAADKLVPLPEEKPSTQWLDGTYLWPDISGIPESAIRWLYLPGTGWVSPNELKRRFPELERNFCYPIITKYRADGVTEEGMFTPLELSYWEYKLLEHRTQERLDHKKFKGGI